MGAAKNWAGFKPLPKNIEEMLTRLPSLFEKRDVLLVYLFGSLAEQSIGHDIDLAILTDEKPPYMFRDELTALLETERLDIVDLRKASPAFCFDIIRAGQLIYAIDDEIRLQFELQIVRQYHDTAYLRQRQEAGLRRRMAAWSSSATVS